MLQGRGDDLLLLKDKMSKQAENFNRLLHMSDMSFDLLMDIYYLFPEHLTKIDKEVIEAMLALSED